MLRVIGISTTVEYLMKGVYENTFGRLTRWIAGGEDTPEDLVIRRAHRAYSDLIFELAWYEFDFGSWIGRIWSETGFFGSNFIRKLERKLSFTLEFGVKAGYAKLIGWASKTAYGEKDTLIYLTATGKDGLAALPAPARIVQSDGPLHLISIPRWGPFTETLPRLAEAGLDFKDISGNTEIAISIIGEAGGTPPAQYATTLFESRVLSSDNLTRHVVRAAVQDLGDFLRELAQSDARLEHIYDY